MTDFLPGNFSFVTNVTYRNIFEYDYIIINKMGDIAWNALKVWNTDNPNYINNIINDSLYPGHTAITYRLSLNNLIYIANNGWENFFILKKEIQ